MILYTISNLEIKYGEDVCRYRMGVDYMQILHHFTPITYIIVILYFIAILLSLLTL